MKKSTRSSQKANIFQGNPADLDSEYFKDIIKTESFLLEKIVSKAHVTPPDSWLKEELNEWVMVLSGEAVLNLNGNSITLHVGEHILIPANTPHRVEYTSKDELTTWLALHFK